MDMDVDKYTRTCSTCKTSYSIFDIEHVSRQGTSILNMCLATFISSVVYR